MTAAPQLIDNGTLPKAPDIAERRVKRSEVTKYGTAEPGRGGKP